MQALHDGVGDLVALVLDLLHALGLSVQIGGVLDHLEERYASEPDVTVEEVECLAACDGAPALQVNYEFHERVSPSSAVEIVEDYRSGTRRARTVSGASVA